MNEREEPTITPADIPGLFDVVLPDGRELRDITQGQLIDLMMRHQWNPPAVV